MEEDKTEDRGNRPPKRRIGGKKRLFFVALLILFNLFLAGAAYLGSVAWRSAILLRTPKDLEKRPNRWIGRPYARDKRYGFLPRTNGLAYHSLQEGERIPARFDENGFRIPYDDPEHGEPPNFRILFLGCSFTHGYGVPAEETFAYLTAKELHASAMNAGVSGWGLSQMVMRARDVIPRQRPDVVVVQYSNWLPTRSMQLYAPVDGAKATAPYFYENSAGTIGIHPPAMRSKRFGQRVSRFAGEDLLPFIWNVGIPLYAHDDCMTISLLFKSRLGRIPLPATSRQKVVEFAYTEIQRLCDANGARMLALELPDRIADPPLDRLDGLSFPLVRTLPALTRNLPEPTSEAWKASYGHWRGDPPRFVDHHPNGRMHRLVAETLVEAIRQLQPKKGAVEGEARGLNGPAHGEPLTSRI